MLDTFSVFAIPTQVIATNSTYHHRHTDKHGISLMFYIQIRITTQTSCYLSLDSATRENSCKSLNEK
jgi:hypothetical protein